MCNKVKIVYNTGMRVIIYKNKCLTFGFNFIFYIT